MKKTISAINILFFSVVLIISLCGNANAQDTSTIKIGTQNWCTKNLIVSTYCNGDTIPQVQDETVWSNLNTGAWCYYENKTENGTTYGKLYNWFAVNDPRGLAPEGFHIPNDADWTILTYYLGGSNVAATKLKSTSGWYDNGKGTNASGFSGLPGGCRGYNGKFANLGSYGIWWSSSENDTFNSWYRELNYYGGNVSRFSSYRELGLSVRCLGD